MNEKNGFDEMQKARRDSIGRQMFVFLVFAILINGLLYSRGIVWLEYQSSVLVISFSCVAIYVIRIAVAGAYLPPNFRGANRKIMIAVCVIFTIAAMALIMQPSWLVGSIWESAAFAALIGSAIYSTRTTVMRVIKTKLDNKKDNED